MARGAMMESPNYGFYQTLKLYCTEMGCKLRVYKMRIRKTLLAPLAALLFLVALVGLVRADGTETLGPPSIPIQPGTGIVAAGVGLLNGQPGIISFSVPSGATVKQALLYWQGVSNSGAADAPNGDNTIEVNGNPVTGTQIGGPTNIPDPNTFINSYRADITSTNQVSPGTNSLTIGGLSFSRSNNGAGVIVIFDDGSGASGIDIRDGSDFAFSGQPNPLDATVPQSFNFASAGSDRTADLLLFVADVADDPNRFRNGIIRVTTGGVVTDFVDQIQSNDGAQWDTALLSVTIPAGANSLTVEIISAGNDPASLVWVAAALVVEPEPPDEEGSEGCTPGYWKQEHHFDSWVGFSPSDDFETVFGVDASFDKTLLGALQQGGGGEKALGRHAVAALLNAASPDVSFAFTEAQVISLVQNAYATGDFEGAKNLLEAQNQQGCPLN
jgi:hypothetical protein